MRLAASKFLLPLTSCTLNCEPVYTLAPRPLKSLLSGFLIAAMENQTKRDASIPPPLLSRSSWASCGSFFFPCVPFLCPSLVTLPLKHVCSDSHLLLAVICIFQTQNFGFLTLSLPETNKILKLCFHLNSKEKPRSENFWHILQRNFLFAIPWYQLQ